MTTQAQLPDSIQQQNERLERIFLPFARRQRDSLYKSKTDFARFVHYTSAESALKIIKSKRVWMRNATCMSDYREVQHGFEILQRFFLDPSKRTSFVQAFEQHVPGSADEAIALFDQWLPDIRLSTYIACLSEHADKEDNHGRLSMWRAFGGSNVARVAMVLRVPGVSAGILNVIFSPVAYLTEIEVHDELNLIIQNVHGNADFLKSLDRTTIALWVFHMLVAGVACLKHQGFDEEREWRVIYSPNRRPSPFIESSTEIIGGIPQLVHKLPLDSARLPATPELDFSRLFDRLIIGPSSYPWVMYQAFVEALKRAGVADADGRVCVSGIPIRS
jgi:hypothetical protein